MREIKFRVWDRQLKLFTYFDFSTCLPAYADKKNYIVQQFTGLRDKNNEEIFIGDIVKHIYEREEPGYGIGIIDWDDMYCGIAITKSNKFFGSGLLNHFAPPDYEVIGNIFETPDLIKR